MAKTLATFLPDIVIEAPSCPDVLLERHLLRAAEEFCDVTRSWLIRTEAFTMIAAQTEYTVNPPSDAVAIGVKSAYWEGRPIDVVSDGWMDDNRYNWRATTGTTVQIVVQQERGKFLVYPTPTLEQVEKLVLSVYLKPTKTATTLPDYLYKHHLDAMEHGTLARVLAQRNRAWTDYESAAFHKKQFELCINKERLYQVRKNETAPRSIQFKKFC